MKLATYFLTSLLAVVAMVIFAMYTREQFYPVILFLVSSKVSFIINVNMIVAIFVSSTAFVNKIFLGNLRDVEVEMLIDKGKYALTETCLAFTIFRNEFSYPTISLFIFLLCVKSFHWLCKARIDYLDQVMPASKWIYFKIGLFLSLLLALDIWTAYSCIIFTMKHGRSASILFGFEFGLLCISALNISTRFLLLVFDQHLTHGVILKGFFVMIVDLICDGLRAVTYTCFFALVFSHYGLPIHIMREVFMAFQIFQRRLISFWKYLKLSRNLEHALPAATEEEIRSAGDCLICRDAMTSGKKLPCSHVFHMDCLRMWLQHQQSCPLCRSDIPTNIPAARSQNTPVVAAGDAANVNIQNPVNIQNVGPMVVQRGLNAYARRRLPGEIAAPVPPPTAPPAVPPAVQTPLDESLSATSTIRSSELVEADSTVPLTPADVQKQRVLYFQQKSMESATSSASTSVSVESPSTNTESLTMKQSAEVKISSLASDRFPEGFHSHLYEGTSAFNQSDGIVESKSDPTILPSFFYIAHGDTTQLLESGAPATSAASSATAASNGFTHLVVSKESSVGSEVVRYIKKGLIVFAFSRHIDSTGDSWLRLTDGWIQELSGGVTFATLYTKQSTAAHAMKGKIESKRLELHGRLASLMPEKASGDFEITDEQSRVAPMPLQSSATQHQQVHHHHHYYANVSPNGNGTITNMPGQKNKTSQDEFVARLQDQVETMNARMIEMQKTLLQMQSTFLEVAKKSNNS